MGDPARSDHTSHMPILKRLFRRNSEPAALPAVDSRNYGRSAVAVDPQALMKIKSLELRARVVVDGFMAGIHRSPWHGFSVEFTEYRQ